MKPDSDCVEGDEDYTLAESGKQYAVFLRNAKGKTLRIHLPQGEYVANGLDPVLGKTIEIARFSHSGGVRVLPIPDEFAYGIALSILAIK
jgi:hypothetical protein